MARFLSTLASRCMPLGFLLLVTLACTDTLASQATPAPHTYTQTPSLNSLLAMRNSLPSQTLRVARIIPDGEQTKRLDNQILRTISDNYLKQISTLLDLEFVYVDLPSPKAAIKALLDHQVDVLPRATGFEKQYPELLLTQPYLPSKPIIIGRAQDQSQPLDLSNMHILVLKEYLPEKKVQEAYPRAKVSPVSDTALAFELLADNKADAFIGDQFRANLYLQQRTDLQLQYKFSAHLDEVGFAFAVRSDERVLLSLLNYALRSIPEPVKKQIRQNVNHSQLPYFFTDSYILTQEELNWLQKHKEITVLADDTPAYLYRKRNGQWSGLSLRLLKAMTLIYGVKINIVESHSAADDLRLLNNGQAQLASRAPPVSDSNLTQAYGTLNWTFLIRDGDNSPSSLAAMEGRRLALSRDHPLYLQLRQRYPNIRLIATENFRHSMDLILNHKVDATLVSTASTQSPPETGLQYGLSIKATPTPHQFSVAPDAPELREIINKLLDAMSRSPQSEIQVIAERPGNTLWKWIADNAWNLGLPVLLIFGLSLLWNWRLQIQVRKRLNAQALLQDKLAFQFSLFNGLPTPLYVCDLHGRLSACNRAYEEFFSTAQELSQGRLLTEQSSLPHDFAQTLQDEHQQLLIDHQPRFLDTSLTINSEPHYLYLWLVPFYNARGQLQGSLGGWLDITARKQLEIKLREAKQVAIQASAAKSEFLAAMSHELRTPLNALVGLLELETSNSRSSSTNLRIAQQSASAMIDLIGNILDLDKIESGQMQLSLQPTALELLLNNSLGLFTPQAQEKNLNLQLDFQADSNHLYWLDTLRLQQIIHNLLSNALRFTEKGGVHLHVRESIQHEGTSLLTLSVCDTGIGIAPDLQPQIFEPYRQATPRTVHCYGGSGLGLTICKQLTELMGGRIWLVSAQGKGTCVHVELPVNWQLNPEPADEPVYSNILPTRTLHVLVVDDVSTNGLVLNLQLARLGHLAEHVCSAEQALLALREKHYDVLITDCNMPGMDGYALTRIVREEEQLHGDSPRLIIGYTANALSNEAAQCYEAGMDDLMIKPVTLARLSKALSALANTPEDEDERTYNLRHLQEADLDTPLLRQRILNELLMNLHQEIAELETLVLAEHPERIDEITHRLSGLACMIDARELAAACHTLRKTDHQDNAAIQTRQSALLDVLRRILAEAGNDLNRLQ